MGAGIGALGGIVFAIILGGETGFDRGGYTGASAIIPMIAQSGRLIMLSAAAFALIGFVLANRVFASQEAMYQSILATGVRAPEQKPHMRGADRWPAIAVGIAAAVIAIFIIVLFAIYW